MTAQRPWVRTTGLFYVGTIVTGVFSVYFVRSLLIVRSDATATAGKILGAEGLFRLGIVAELAGIFCYVVVTALLYDMLKPVNRRVALITAFFSLVGCAVGAAQLFNDVAALTFLKGGSHLTAFNAAQLQGLAYAFLRLSGQVNALGLLFFAVYCMLTGGLIWRSGFLPRFIGALLILSGLAWLSVNLAVMLAPTVAATLAPLSFVGILGETALTLWLLVFGIDGAKWDALARA